MPAYGPALTAEVAPQGVKITNELVQCPRALVPGPAAAALIVTVHPYSRASEAGQWLQVVPQARPAMAQHQRLAPAGDLCPQTAAIAHRHQVSRWPAAHPPIITGCLDRADLPGGRGELGPGGGALNAGNAAGQRGDFCRAGRWSAEPGSPG